MAAPKIGKLLTPYNFTSKGNAGRIKYIVIHYVGALGGAKANCQYYASKYIGASAHYFVGFSGEIWQSVDDGDVAWHCGASSYRHEGCRNSNSIGIELCVRNKGSQTADSKDWYFERATVEAAARLTRHLMEKYGVDAAHVIRHHDVTGKICPNPYVYNTTKHTWDAFKKALGGEEPSREEGTKGTGGGGQAAPSKGEGSPGEGEPFTPYTITTTCDALNIRSGAGTGHSVVGAIREKAGKKNKYTIVEEKDGWGRLKSGAGWISLPYTKKAAASGEGKQPESFTPYPITTTCDVLNIRSGAGAGHSVVGAIREKAGKKNKYTIVEEKDGWGRLKSGAGWISLSYTKKAP